MSTSVAASVNWNHDWLLCGPGVTQDGKGHRTSTAPASNTTDR